MLDFRIETFLTLCETLNFTKAAKLLNITQPAVTMHIRYLEQQYGVKLFLYSGKTLSLTEKGKQLRKYAISMRNDSRKIAEEMSKENDSTILLKIGATKTIGEFVIAPVICRFLRENPNYNIKLAVDNTRNLFSMLESGNLDFLIVEGFFDKTAYDYDLYKIVDYYGICGKDNKFANKCATIEQLFGENIIVREKGSGTRDIFEQILSENNFTLENFRRITEISDFSVINRLVAENQGISFLYEPAAKSAEKMGAVQLKIEGLRIKREFNYVFLKNNLFADRFEPFFKLAEEMDNEDIH